VDKTQLLLIFDLDGTLVDSLGDLAASASELVTTFGGRALPAEEVATMVGEGAKLLVQRAMAAAGLDPATPDAYPQFMAIYERRLLETTRPYPGMHEALQLATRRARLAVLTNKPAAPATRILDALDLARYFDRVIGGDDPLGRKPEPAGLRELARSVTQVLMIGDSPIDWMAASAAGCGFAWARYGFGAARFDDPPDTPYVLNRPSDLPAVLDRFTSVTAGA
jgi:phosphoglycolate phosphatase